MEKNPRFDRCFNPFNLKNHSKTKSLQKANAFIQEKLDICGTYFLCIDCKKRAYSDAKQLETTDDKNSDTEDDDQNIDNVDIAHDNINIEDDVEADVDNHNVDRKDSKSDEPYNFSLENASQGTDLLESLGNENENDHLPINVLSSYLLFSE